MKTKQYKKLIIYSVIVFALFLFPSASLNKKHVNGPIKIGFIPLTDCSPVVMAKEYGLFKKYGVEVELSKEASWANIRDKVLSGELDAAHCLFGMPFSVYTGVGGKAGSEMKIAMILNVNGQAITLSNDFCGKVGFKQTNKVASVVDARLQAGKEVTFAATFPGGTHDMWLRNYLALAGVPQNKVKLITIPPPQMVANMKVGNMDGYCVGEPWNGVAVKQGVGFTTLATQDIWKDHPEKALVVNKTFAETRRDDLKKVMKAVLEACRLLDKPANRVQSAPILGQAKYVNAPADVIDNRLKGVYDLGCSLGTEVYKDYMMFHKNGMVNYPRKSYGIWFLAQYVRFGLLSSPPDYKGIADKLIMQDLYNEVAGEMGIPIPNDDMKPFSLSMDKTLFDPNNPTEYLKNVKK
ncbi:MAG: ABC transporter substrate-binding protein [Cytophagaceae bacterium]|nr:ABC transporter substrate-binding protein [Cytophagaceae bacterium]MDW8456050.1 CmpA/NrtA family ABC transporter substrate-binding protein [Cytophagaceae bacterium]